MLYTNSKINGYTSTTKPQSPHSYTHHLLLILAHILPFTILPHSKLSITFRSDDCLRLGPKTPRILHPMGTRPPSLLSPLTNTSHPQAREHSGASTASPLLARGTRRGRGRKEEELTNKQKDKKKVKL